MEISLFEKIKYSVLALGAESSGNFSYFHSGKIYHSSDFGDLLAPENWKKFKKSLRLEMKRANLRPKIILSDLHPDLLTTKLAAKLAKKYNTKHIPIQHHTAHIFSAIGERLIQNTRYKIPNTIYGIACDGTGLGLDGKIWGGEVFKVQSSKFKVQSVKRVGHLENQMLIGGDLAIKEPARMLIGILSKFIEKEDVYNYIKKHYTRNEFELIYNQLKQRFNCQETSSTGRILDAVSILLDFCENTRHYKHEPINMLEKNSTRPYGNIKPKIIKIYDENLKTFSYELDTTYLFNYVISAIGGSASGGNSLPRDKHRLAATAQFYIAEGLYELLKANSYNLKPVFFAGGMANNKIISTFLEYKGAYVSKKIPRGDAGISFGQIIYYLLTNPRD